jgi:oligopeptide transport system substrate-binding protein
MAGRLKSLLVLLFTTICSLHGCGAGNDGVPENGTGSGAVIIHRGNGGDAQTLDPARAQDEHTFNVLADLYEGLLAIDASGNIVDAAASFWEVSDDGLVYTFRLAADARWSTGAPVTAEHFVAGMRRALAPETGSAYNFLLHPIRNAQAIASGRMPITSLGVTAVDNSTLTIELHSPAAYFPSVLTMPIAFPYFGDVDILHERYSDPDAFVGNGPFLLDEWHPGSHIRLRKNPLFREAELVAVDGVQYFAITEPVTELTMFLAGELDITSTVPGSHVKSLKETHAAELQIAPSLALYYLAFDLSEAPFDNAALRKALSMAIDRHALVEVIGRGEQPAFGLVPGGVNNYEPARFDWAALPAEERQAQARRYYVEAGYSVEQSLRLTLLYDAGDIHETIVLAVAAMWRGVLGVEVELDKREWKYFLATRENRDDWQVMRFAWSGDYDHPGTFADILRSASPQNLPGYKSDRYDRLLSTAEAAKDPQEQMRLYALAEAELLADNPIVPLYFFVSKHLVAPGVSGFESNVLDRHPSRYLQKTPVAR